MWVIEGYGEWSVRWGWVRWRYGRHKGWNKNFVLKSFNTSHIALSHIGGLSCFKKMYCLKTCDAILRSDIAQRKKYTIAFLECSHIKSAMREILRCRNMKLVWGHGSYKELKTKVNVWLIASDKWLNGTLSNFG